MTKRIEYIFNTIMIIYIIASFADLIICGQMAWHKDVELASWNFIKIILSWYGIVC